jgi:hypothetical protein
MIVRFIALSLPEIRFGRINDAVLRGAAAQ